MHDVAFALVAVGGSLLTGLLVAWAERADQRQRDLENAMSDFLAAITKAVGFLHGMPQLNERHPVVVWSKVSAKLGDLVAPGRTWVTSRRQLRRILGDEPFLPAERVVDAAARLRVLDPGPALNAAMDEALDYIIELGDNRAAEKLARWPKIRQNVLDGIAATKRNAA